jgi:hypothetical protein
LALAATRFSDEQLRVSLSKFNEAKWRLAATYALVGQKKQRKKL